MRCGGCGCGSSVLDFRSDLVPSVPQSDTVVECEFWFNKRHHISNTRTPGVNASPAERLIGLNAISDTDFQEKGDWGNDGNSAIAALPKEVAETSSAPLIPMTHCDDVNVFALSA